MAHSAPSLPLELLRYTFRLLPQDWKSSREEDGSNLALVCRSWTVPGQELVFYCPDTWGYTRRDAILRLADHFDLFPHLALHVRVLRLDTSFAEKELETQGALGRIIQHCRLVKHIEWPHELEVLTTELANLPLANLTSLEIGKSARSWDSSPLLSVLPQCTSLRALQLIAALPGEPNLPLNPPQCAALPLQALELQINFANSGWQTTRTCTPVKVEAIFLQRIFRSVLPGALTFLRISLQIRNLRGVTKWVKECASLDDLNFCVVDADLNDILPELSVLVSDMAHLTRLRLTRLRLEGEPHPWYDSVGRDWQDYRLRTGLAELAAEFSCFFDAIPGSVRELEADVWVPAGDCYNLFKTFLRSRLSGSPLETVGLDIEVRKAGRMRVEAKKLRRKRKKSRRRMEWELVRTLPLQSIVYTKT